MINNEHEDIETILNEKGFEVSKSKLQRMIWGSGCPSVPYL